MHAPTCTETGEAYRHCTRCDEEGVTVTLPANGHSFTHTTVAPTCTAVGYTEHTCTVCGYSYTNSETPIAAHDYDSDNPCYLRCCKNCKAFILPSHKDVLIKTETEPTFAAAGYGLYRCENCRRETHAAIPLLKPTDLGMPAIYLSGSMQGMSKDNEVVLSVTYESTTLNFSCVAKMKWQGASSASYPKKNYTIKLYRDETLDKKYKVDPFGWGKENKYCLKANWVDFSQSRNVVAGRLWGDVCKTRTSLLQNLSAAPNYGAVDGYPIVLYHDGDFLGMYTINIPKDEWMFGMNDKSPETREALLFTNDWGASPALREEINRGWSNGWKLEYCSTEDGEWARESMNRLIRFLNDNDGPQLRAGLSEYLDIDAAIDAMLFTYVICGGDNTAKNTIWVTYDGNVWFPSVYDMDGTFGMFWNGSFNWDYASIMPHFRANGSISDGVDNLLWQKLFDNYSSEIKARYLALRKSALSMENIEDRFDEFFDSVPEELYKADAERWPSVPSHKENNRKQILTFTEEQLARLDAFFAGVK